MCNSWARQWIAYPKKKKEKEQRVNGATNEIRPQVHAIAIMATGFLTKLLQMF